jgi:hypothetical protein
VRRIERIGIERLRKKEGDIWIFSFCDCSGVVNPASKTDVPLLAMEAE